jgi:hypothetical protein
MFMTSFLLSVGCFLLAPYFNSYCAKDSDQACGSAYLMGVAYAVVLVNIHNVVSDLESSFDHIGVDDIHFNIREHLSRLHHGVPGKEVSQNLMHECITCRRTLIVCLCVVVFTAAFFKHDEEGYYIIQSPKRFELANGILGLHDAELDLYAEMHRHSNTLSHSEKYESESANEMRKKLVSAKENIWTQVSTKLSSQAPHDDNMRSFGQAVLRQNRSEVNKFSQRGGKKQILVSEDDIQNVQQARRASRVGYSVRQVFDCEMKDATNNV